jgi:hypothetical protein
MEWQPHLRQQSEQIDMYVFDYIILFPEEKPENTNFLVL